MGKTRTTVATQVMRAIEDARLPDAVSTGTTKALLQNGEVVDYVLEEAVSSIGLRAERAYQYAKSGGYTFGLPSGNFTNPNTQVQAAVEKVLRRIEDPLEQIPVEIDYLHYGVANNLHVGWIELIANYDYSPETNIIGTLSRNKGVPVYLDDIVVSVPSTQYSKLDKESLKMWGKSPRSGYTPERTALTPAAQALITHTAINLSIREVEYLVVKYVWLENGVLKRDFFWLESGSFGSDSLYYQVRYEVMGKAKYWLYAVGSGIYPTLDNIHDREPELGGSFFPFTYFRHNKQSVIKDKTSAEYKTSKKLMKYLGMDYDQVATAVDQNPDIADVEQAVLLFAVPANTTVEIERAYLWTFFDNLYLSQDPAYRFKSEQIANMDLFPKIFTTLTSTAPSIVIQDTRFKMSLNNSGIFKKKVTGVIAKVGMHSSGYDSSNDFHYYRKQLAQNVYEEIQVKNLQTIYRIYDGWWVAADDKDKILLVPLDHSISKDYSVLDRELLYSRSLHYVFNSRVTTKLKWYETGIFKGILTIIAIVATISGAWEAGAAIWAAIGAGSYALAALLVLTLVLEYLVITLAFRLFVKVVGIKVALVAAVVAAAYGVKVAIQAGSLSGAPFAMELLTAASNISVAIGNAVAQDIYDLMGEYKAFELLKEEKLEALETADQLLGNTNHLEPFVIFGEKPDDFYNRTVHSGNIGVMGIEAISSFVEMKLRLPKLTETIQEGGEYGYV